MAKKVKKMSPYDQQRVNETSETVFAGHMLSMGMTIMPYVDAERVEKMRHTHLLQHHLLFTPTAQLQQELSKISWDKVMSPCATLYASGRLDAMRLAPIQWWGSAHSVSNSNQLYTRPVFGSNVVEHEWIVCEFLSRRAQAKIGSLNISPDINGANLAATAQKAMWSVLSEKGLTGNTRLRSYALCGIGQECKMLDIALVYSEDPKAVAHLLDSTDFSQSGCVEDTLLAMHGFHDNWDLKEQIAQKMAVSKVNWSKVWDKERVFDQGGINITISEGRVPLLAATLLLLGQEKVLPPTLKQLRTDAFKSFASLSATKQADLLDWLLPEACNQLFPEALLTLFSNLHPYTKEKLQPDTLNALIALQMEDNVFSNNDVGNDEVAGLALLLKTFPTQQIVGEDGVNWILDSLDVRKKSNNHNKWLSIGPWVTDQWRPLFDEMLKRIPSDPEAWQSAREIQTALVKNGAPHQRGIKRKM